MPVQTGKARVLHRPLREQTGKACVLHRPLRGQTGKACVLQASARITDMAAHLTVSNTHQNVHTQRQVG